MKARFYQKQTNLNPLLLSNPIGKDSLPVKIVLPGMPLIRILMIKQKDKLTFCALFSWLSSTVALLCLPSSPGLQNLLMDQWTNLPLGWGFTNTTSPPGLNNPLMMDQQWTCLAPSGSHILLMDHYCLTLPPAGRSLIINAISFLPFVSFTAALAAWFFTCKIFLSLYCFASCWIHQKMCGFDQKFLTDQTYMWFLLWLDSTGSSSPPLFSAELSWTFRRKRISWHQFKLE